MGTISQRATSQAEKLLISVVIPAHNEEKYLSACLQSLADQAYPADAYEVIVVDNASSDATPHIARSFGARVIPEPMKCISRARQAGFAAAQGQVIASTDADTVVPRHWLARIAHHFSCSPDLGGVYGPVRWPRGRAMDQLIMHYPVRWAMALSNQIHRSWWLGNNFAVREDIFWEVGGFSDFDPQGLMGEDLFLSIKVSRVSRVLFDPGLVVDASERRAGEGHLNYLQRMAVSAVRVAVLSQPALPHPDIR